jgi:hypothetical protein
MHESYGSDDPIDGRKDGEERAALAGAIAESKARSRY